MLHGRHLTCRRQRRHTYETDVSLGRSWGEGWGSSVSRGVGLNESGDATQRSAGYRRRRHWHTPDAAVATGPDSVQRGRPTPVRVLQTRRELALPSSCPERPSNAGARQCCDSVHVMHQRIASAYPRGCTDGSVSRHLDARVEIGCCGHVAVQTPWRTLAKHIRRRFVNALVQGHGVCDHNSFERAMNVLSSIPYTVIGLHTLRCGSPSDRRPSLSATLGLHVCAGYVSITCTLEVWASRSCRAIGCPHHTLPRPQMCSTRHACAADTWRRSPCIITGRACGVALATRLSEPCVSREQETENGGGPSVWLITDGRRRGLAHLPLVIWTVRRLIDLQAHDATAADMLVRLISRGS